MRRPPAAGPLKQVSQHAPMTPSGGRPIARVVQLPGLHFGDRHRLLEEGAGPVIVAVQLAGDPPQSLACLASHPEQTAPVGELQGLIQPAFGLGRIGRVQRQDPQG